MALPVLLFAMAAQAASPSAQEQDLRCIAVMAAIIGKADESKRAAVTPLMMYYVGRANGRDPALKLEPELRRVYGDTAAFGKSFPVEAARCGAEMEVVGKDLMRIGDALKQSETSSK
ncbi:MAG: hypothetical protein V4530_10425 [Pseudomonadota bacterium]